MHGQRPFKACRFTASTPTGTNLPPQMHPDKAQRTSSMRWIASCQYSIPTAPKHQQGSSSPVVAERLVAVTNALGPDQAVTSYHYDEAGNETAQVDANQHTTTFSYDSLGRRTKRVMPGNQAETFGYDLASNLAFITNFNGWVITNQYDVLNRLTNRVSVNGYRVLLAYSPTGQRTNMDDLSGPTSYTYASRDRLP